MRRAGALAGLHLSVMGPPGTITHLEAQIGTDSNITFNQGPVSRSWTCYRKCPNGFTQQTNSCLFALELEFGCGLLHLGTEKGSVHSMCLHSSPSFCSQTGSAKTETTSHGAGRGEVAHQPDGLGLDAGSASHSSVRPRTSALFSRAFLFL